MHDIEHYSTWLDELIERANSLPRDATYRDWIDSARFDGWTAAVDQFLVELLGPESVYYLDFDRVSRRTGVYPARAETDMLGDITIAP